VIRRTELKQEKNRISIKKKEKPKGHVNLNPFLFKKPVASIPSQNKICIICIPINKAYNSIMCLLNLIKRDM
jgi:hypothetical protein